MENEIAKKMYLYYNELLSERDCKDLAETNSIEFQVILSIASNICIADYKLI